ncbi:hypothetical protein PQG02_21440 [Nostoc sp. UHCC 0926]|nr:hypothetical protein [Nostoc sp. UHCC 0926]WDD31268.1 hypothetical protein PQG02_21440 [Nostoc sp. UHCC 0926]
MNYTALTSPLLGEGSKITPTPFPLIAKGAGKLASSQVMMEAE